jgi:magnesium transporter
MPNTLFLPELREMLAEQDLAGLREFCTALHPARTAEFMEGLTPEESWQVLQNAESPLREEIFQHFDLERQAEILRVLPATAAGSLVARLAPDDRVDVLKQLEPTQVSEILAQVPLEARRDILRLAAYPENTAGAVMTTAFAKVAGTLTVREALEDIARQAAELETIYYIYVVDEVDHLQGVVSARSLVAAMGRPDTLIGDLAERSVISVDVSEDQEEVARKVAQFDLLAVPVVDVEHHILGIITHDDVMDVVVDEATEDAHRMGGVTPIAEDILEAKFVTVWRKRAGWLSLLFFAELFTFTALANFEEAIEAVVALSLFVPLVISTGGNSGSQAATLITRALALNQVSPRDWLRVFRHELLMGFALGTTLGMIGYVRAALTPQSVLGIASRWNVAMVIAESVAAVCLWGTLVGSLLPLLFRRLGIDPGFASSPFVATFVDVTGIVIYFSIAQTHLL